MASMAVHATGHLLGCVWVWGSGNVNDCRELAHKLCDAILAG